MKKRNRNSLGGKMLYLALATGFLCLPLAEKATAQQLLVNPDIFSLPQNLPAQSGHRVTANISLPGNSDDYNKQAGVWALNSQSTYRYNAAGQLVSRLRTTPASSQNMSKDSLDYDSHGRVIFEANYQWVNNNWHTSFGQKYQTTYNGNGQLTEVISQSHSSGVWTNSERETTTYHANGSPLEETTYRWVNNTWQLYSKRTYTYGTANNAPTELLEQKYQNNTWVNERRFTNVIWHNYARFELLSYISQRWVNNAWENYQKPAFTYDAFGGYVNIVQRWMNNTWTNYHRGSVSYDSKLNFIGEKGEYWQNNAWVVSHDNQEVLTYNGNGDITERIFRNWDNSNNVFNEPRKEVYSNFRYISGIKKEIPQLMVNLYPNPASEVLNLQLEGRNPVTLQLADLTGRVVLKQNLETAINPQISLSALAKGIYLLKLESTEGMFTSKVIKQ